MSMNVKIYEGDTVVDIARKIYNEFDVMASCRVSGFVTIGEKLVPKGELVIKALVEFDELENMRELTSGKKQRVYKYRKDSIGGPIAHKIFTFEKRIVDDEPRYNIWRYQ